MMELQLGEFHRGYKSEGLNDFDRKLSPKSKSASRDPLWNWICQFLVISAVVQDNLIYRKAYISAQLGSKYLGKVGPDIICGFDPLINYIFSTAKNVINSNFAMRRIINLVENA